MTCMLRDGAKTVQVCMNGEDAVYRFGSTGAQPELEITTPLDTVDYLPWPGIGRDIWETVTFANGPYRYEVATGFSRPMEGDDSDLEPTYGSIVITRNALPVTRLECDPGSVDWSYGGGLYDAKTSRGLCWGGYPAEVWLPCSKE